MIVKLLTEHHLEFLNLNGGCIGSSESTHVKIPHCWNLMHWLNCNKCPPGNGPWFFWFQSLTRYPLCHDVKPCESRNNRTYWTDNPSIGHIRIHIQGKNFEIVYIVDVVCFVFIRWIFRTCFSYFLFSRKCGNIHMT